VEDVKSVNALENNVYSLIAVRNGDQLIPKIFAAADKEGIMIESIRLKRPTLDDVYLTYTGKTIREAESSGEEAAKERIKMRRIRRWETLFLTLTMLHIENLRSILDRGPVS
jgi:ABC-2 type transport system ATP-binding protein